MSSRNPRFDVVGQLGAMRRYARSLTRNDADAEDLVQDTLVKALEKRAAFDRDGSLRGWLLSILHTTFLDRVRQKRSEAARLQRIGETAEWSVPAGQEHAARLSEVRASFMRLPEEQRTALHLVSIEGLSYEAAADVLKIPVGTLVSRVSRGRAALRQAENEPAAAGATVHHLKLVGGRDDLQS